MEESPNKMYALASVMLVVSVVAVALRFAVRTKQKKGLGLDDWLIVPALMGAIGTAAAIYSATIYGGLGNHTQIAPDGMPLFTEQTVAYLKASFISQLTQMVSFGFTKLSVLFFYRRLFSGKAYFNIASWVMIVIVCMWTVAFFFAQLYQCVPIEANWLGPLEPDATCINALQVYRAGAWSDAATDGLILILPLPIIWNLQLTKGRKIALSGIFLLGALTVLSSIARLVVYYNIEAQLDAGGIDVTWILAPTFYWPMIESALGILGACLPPMRPLFNGFSPETVIRSLRGTMSRASSSRNTASWVSGPDPEKRTWVGTPTPTFRDTWNSRRPKDEDSWSFHSDAESFGYYAEVCGKGVAVRKVQDMV